MASINRLWSNILGVVIVLLVAISMVSAIDFFPVHDYNYETKTATIYADFLKIQEVAKIELISNTEYCLENCEAVIRITPNKDITADSSNEYNILIKDLTKTKDMSSKVKSISYEKKTGTETYNSYEETGQSCHNTTTGNGTYETCTPIYSNVQRTRDVWQSFTLNPAFFKKIDGSVDIKIKGVKDRDASVDWIPTFYGVQIDEMATWTNGLNVGLVAYFDGNSTNNLITYNPMVNLTDLEGTPVYGSTDVSCKIGKCINVSNGKNFKVKANTKTDLTANDNTIAFWVKGQTNGANPYAIGSPTNGKQQIGWDAPTQLYYGATWMGSGGNKYNMPYNNWYYITITKNATKTYIYNNGTLITSGTGAPTNEDLYFGNIFNLLFDWDGQFDEIAFWNRSLTPTEISDLYNNGAGLTYVPDAVISMTVVNSKPSNYQNFSTSSITFGCNATGTSLTNVKSVVLSVTNGSIIWNQTITGLNQESYNAEFINTTLVDGTYNWTCTAYGDTANATNSSWLFTKDTTAPTINIYYPTTIIPYAYLGQNISLNYSISDTNIGSCWKEYDGTNTTISCTKNSSLILTTQKNITIWANDTFGNVNSLFRSWLYEVFENNRSLSNSTTYQTSLESFNINVTSNASLTAVSLNYDGTNYTATQSGEIWTSNVLIPSTMTGNKTYYWIFTYGTTKNSYSSYQYVNSIDFRLCNDTNNVKYLNVTFRDELTSTAINGTLIPITVTYYLHNATQYKTYTLTNSSVNNNNYTFCYSPTFQTIKTDISGSSSMTSYPTRYWTVSYNLTNVSTDKIVDLLANADGVYQTVQVINGAGNPISGATVTASTPILGMVDTRTTDAAGQLTLWLDPNKAHTLLTTATGYPSDTRVINPTPLTTVTVILGGTSSYPTNLSATYTEGISYSFEPTQSILYNETSYTFKFIIDSGTHTIQSFGYNLLNSTGDIVDTQSLAANGGTVSGAYNVENNTKMTMRAYYIVLGNRVDLSHSWVVQNSADTDYSILFFGNRVHTYIDSGFFGLKSGLGLNLFSFLIIFITIGIFSWKFGVSNEIIISIATLFMVWLFEFGLGLINIGGNIPMTFWVAIVTVALLIKEGLKLI